MPIKLIDTNISEVKIIEGTRFNDNRGFFTETYKELEYLEIGIPKFVQDNMSESSAGVIRGLHWQETPFGQGKLVKCLSGSILDIAVDIRIGSDTYGQHVAVTLKSSEAYSLWIPEGFAHGFQALENETRVIYKVTNYWNQEAEKSLNPLDSDLKIEWAQDLPHILSNKDAAAPSFSEAF
jgi:dTDP-4-dehydrorhamnose 3,5-epimerase